MTSSSAATGAAVVPIGAGAARGADAWAAPLVDGVVPAAGWDGSAADGVADGVVLSDIQIHLPARMVHPGDPAGNRDDPPSHGTAAPSAIITD
jgi:hypothetical protein